MRLYSHRLVRVPVMVLAGDEQSHVVLLSAAEMDVLPTGSSISAENL